MSAAVRRRHREFCGPSACLIVCLLVGSILPQVSGEEFRTEVRPLLQQYCFDCHGEESAEANVNLQRIAAAAEFGRHFKDWEKVTRMLRARKMPPEEMPQPSEAQRQMIVRAIETGLDTYIEQHAGDPGPVVLRRLTSAEYAYTIQDLTGLKLDVARGFVSDAAGGAGFTNAGGAQFMQDATLERYLEAAKFVAAHAVIGSGPLMFFADPGQTGRELSAITRIQQIYRRHGFRTAAGEGAVPFGLDLYPRAFFVAWQFRYREELGLGDVSLASLAKQQGLSIRFCEHIWNVLNSTGSPFPTSLILSSWHALPPPGRQSEERIRAQCWDLSDLLRDWQSTLAAAAGDEEEASVLTAGEVNVSRTHSLRADLSWAEGAEVAQFDVSLSRASNEPIGGAVVIWRNPRLRFRREDRRRDELQPLSSFVTEETGRRLALGAHPTGAEIGEEAFVLTGAMTAPVIVQIPKGRITAELFVDVELDTAHGVPSIVRCRISDGEVEGETAAEVGATSTLLADPRSERVAAWRAGVAEFARLLPEVSHREPAPSDRDPIPPPFDNTYNMPERNHFHYAVKYHRDDAFFVEHIADDTTRRKLDQAWTDLLTSFEYHDANLRFASQKFALGLDDASVGDLNPEMIERVPAPQREFVRHLSKEFAAMQQALQTAQPGHVEDSLQFAARAWRRPLSQDERGRLRSYYSDLRHGSGLEHERAVRTLLTRILVAPGFLYRIEPPAGEQGIVPLSDWQLASRLSYLIWSSGPDDELRRTAAAGRLREPQELERQARRMLRSPKARRLAREFFGQWLGFYQFDQYRGIDTERFPEFTDRLKSAMYEEAVSFFDYIVREDRPIDEILFADYTFLNRMLAEHYGIEADHLRDDRFSRVDNLARHHRGGLLGLSAVLTATSAPLRTSAVKRGDWVLRRVVGNPVPPPPADAGSIPADDVLADGLTVRKRLEAHRQKASCVNCHSRIDPLGFALEPYDVLGRWRETYRDGQPIDPSGTLTDGTDISGPDGLKDYLRRERAQVQRTLCTKFLGYSLGRMELASDRPLIDGMMRELENGGRFADLIVRIVLSDQFRNRRSGE